MKLGEKMFWNSFIFNSYMDPTSTAISDSIFFVFKCGSELVGLVVNVFFNMFDVLQQRFLLKEMQTHNYSFILNRDKGCYSWVPFFGFPIDAMFVRVKNILYHVTLQQKKFYHVKQ